MWLFIVLALAFIVGSAMILLHTANMPRLPTTKEEVDK
ncbi:MAG: DUF2897 family protein [Methylococcaceae bacterium]|nr:DUF2897 family protein [Methylococcaceae bacterium]